MTEAAPELAIIGGGISGLYAAYKALQMGARHIHVYEESARLGGKIESGKVDGKTINRGAEFIDSEETRMISLARELRVALQENTNRRHEQFLLPTGRVLSGAEFYEAYAPYAMQVNADKALLEKEQAQANLLPDERRRLQLLHQQSVAQYADWLRDKVVLPDQGDAAMNYAQRQKAMESLRLASACFSSEVGQPPRNISATQFIAETRADESGFLSCDEKYRIEGGTEKLVESLRHHLHAKGVVFHTQARLQKVDKDAAGEIQLQFADARLNTNTPKLILALPAYAYKHIHGLNKIGVSWQQQEVLSNLQHTDSFKFTIALKPGAQVPHDKAFYSPEGWQCWSPQPGLLTFLSNAEFKDVARTSTPMELIRHRLQDFARAHGAKAEDMFDMHFPPGMQDYNYPGNNPCYATPKPGQGRQLEVLAASLPQLAQHNVGMAGTFLPLEGRVGFMECGAASAERACELVFEPVREKPVALIARGHQWRERVSLRPAAQPGVAAGVAAG